VQPGSLESKAENSPVEPDQVKRPLARALYLACFSKQASVLCAGLVMRAATAFPKCKMVPAHGSCLLEFAPAAKTDQLTRIIFPFVSTECRIIPA
jgi:hypothetical protein